MKNKRKYMRVQGKRVALVGLCRRALLFFALSFGGWALETLTHYAAHSEFIDRGFLTLPFCPIYGSSIILTAYFFGVPQELDGLLDRAFLNFGWSRRLLSGRAARVVFYFIEVTLVSTLAELVTGTVFKLIGMPLWDYSEKPLNLFGVICLHYSLLWGALITAFMGLLWKPAVRLFERINGRAAIIGAITLGTAATVDFTVNLILYFAKQ